jgi:hypothetical protein
MLVISTTYFTPDMNAFHQNLLLHLKIVVAVQAMIFLYLKKTKLALIWCP